MQTLPFCRATLVALLFSFVPAVGSAAVTLPKIFSSHAVFQRNQPIHVWGWAGPAEQVTVAFDGASAPAIADRFGRWNLYLPAKTAGGPFELTVTGTNKIVFEDIMVGDVWIASGQSNMEMPLSGFPNNAVVNNSEEEIRNAANPRLRLLMVPRRATHFPTDDLEGAVFWTPCTPETAAKFSAVAYFFGRAVAADQNVTIGLIDSTWGGTPAEAWTSLGALTHDASLMPAFASWARMADEQKDMTATIRAEKQEDETARANHAPPPKHPWHPDPASWAPSWLYNGMISPLVPFGIKGAIWYQGESNTNGDRPALYHRVFSTMIQDWRNQWTQGDFPFLFVQISSFNGGNTGGWPTVRDQQRRTLSLINTGMAVTIDVGDAGNVHPSDKQTVGGRLALAARALAYHEPIEYSGPLFRQAAAEQDSMRLVFDHGDGLAAKGGTVTGFEVAGDDRVFKPATARIDGGTVVAASTEVKSPKYVRYAWKDVPDANLVNAAGLPASPFTSESID